MALRLVGRREVSGSPRVALCHKWLLAQSSACSSGALGCIGTRDVMDSLHHVLSPGTPGLCHRRWFGSSSGDGSMVTRHSERKLLVGVSPEDMFSVVSQVKEYHEFVPWCQKSVVMRGSPDEEYMEASLEVGFQMFVESYVSKVSLKRGDGVYQVKTRTDDSSLFSHLNSCWKLNPGPTPKSVWVDFEVDFAFKSALYRQVASVFLEEVVKKMMGAFEGRCREVYGVDRRKKNHSVLK
jgi:ribosome-associated toxin RatA of RatAB toxin-antitoxin module